MRELALDHVAIGGGGEIRTHEWLAPLPVFKTGAFNRSAILPLTVLAPANLKVTLRTG
jgi:hypothetical protein